MKAMILAAGRGERLRPLTDSTPKALVQVGPHRLIEYHLYNLAKQGITDIVINVSYLKEAIIECLGDGSRYGVRIQYSVEESGPLETGGGVFQALNLGLLDPHPFVLLSADIWTEFPLQSLPITLKEGAHLVLVDNPSYHPQGDFGFDGGRLNNAAPRLTFANMSVLHPSLFAGSQSGVFKLAPLLKRAIDAGLVSGVHYRGPWFNVGDRTELEELRNYLDHK